MATHNPFFVNKLNYPKIVIENGKITDKPIKIKTKKKKKKKVKKEKTE